MNMKIILIETYTSGKDFNFVILCNFKGVLYLALPIASNTSTDRTVNVSAMKLFIILLFFC